MTITWAASSNDDDRVGYNVYVNNAYADTVFDNTYTGPVVEGEQMSFYLFAFDSLPRRNYSQRSEELVLQVGATSAGSGSAPSPPTNLMGDIANGRVSIEWNASNDDRGVRGYNIFRDGDYLTTVANTRYSEVKVAGLEKKVEGDSARL